MATRAQKIEMERKWREKDRARRERARLKKRQRAWRALRRWW